MNKVIDIVEIGDSIDDVDWVPGVPCLLDSEQMYLGVDAFSKSRELTRKSVLTQKITT